ncbi:Calcium-binding mitochondrial carrier protein SCaMC-1-A [Lamellibrachia satsuma]|nr:Calcium-binding mitochondrial carrier protein SCaMC-1-A [Lamellibrachia satsuma]
MVTNHRCPDVSLSQKEERELSDLFNKLDVNRDGHIDVNDLTAAFQNLDVPRFPGHIKVFFEHYDSDKSGHITFTEFVTYMVEHDKQLKLSFQQLDHKNDGAIDADELMTVFSKMGVHIDRSEANRLLSRLDRENNLQVSWEEWRDYFRLHPTTDLMGMVHYWRHGTIIDVGESLLVPDDFTEQELQTGMWWRHLLAGGAAGILSRTCTAPLDRLKVILQVHGNKHDIKMTSGFRHMVKEGGYRSLWRGNGINVIKIAPESALKFMVYEQIKRLMKADPSQELGIMQRFAAGSLAGVCAQSAIYPMEVLKTRLVLRKTGQYSGISDCARKVYAADGIKSFYRGYLPNILGIIPYAGIDLAIYETLKGVYTERHPKNEDPGVLVQLACGTVSSTCGQLASYPLALVRTKLQAKVEGAANTMVGMFRTIIENEGPRGLYRGITPNFIKVAPAVSISYVVYEHVRKLLGVEMT